MTRLNNYSCIIIDKATNYKSYNNSEHGFKKINNEQKNLKTKLIIIYMF